MKRFVLDKTNFKKFFVDKNGRRMIRMGQVKSISDSLGNGIHFEVPLVLNYITKDNLFLALDGNHRYDAMLEQFLINPDFEIVVWCAVYTDLTPEEEKAAYKTWNMGLKQSATDFLKAYWETIPLRNDLLRRLPVSIYGTNTLIPVKSFVGNQINAKKNKERFEGGYSGGPLHVVSDFKNLTNEDIDLLEEFYNLIRQVLGDFNKKVTHFYTTTGISALYRIWYDNRTEMSEDKMIAALSKVLNPKDALLLDASKAGGRSAAVNFYDGVLYKLNRGSTKFKTDAEGYEIRKALLEERAKMNEIIAITAK